MDISLETLKDLRHDNASYSEGFDFINPVSYTHLTLPTICSV